MKRAVTGVERPKTPGASEPGEGARRLGRQRSSARSIGDGLDIIAGEIVACERCPRLRAHCRNVAQIKRAAYREDEYWGRPVPGFGDPKARILIVGLAPGAHGANRTGRLFTGDRSGDFLYASLHRTGLANQPDSLRRGDGLALRGAFISAVARCAPPDNHPDPEEVRRCLPFLTREIQVLPHLKVMVALGKIAFDGLWSALALLGHERPRPRPVFGHGAEVAGCAEIPAVVSSYHPSQQNTQTGRLTPAMLDEVFGRARVLAEG